MEALLSTDAVPDRPDLTEGQRRHLTVHLSRLHQEAREFRTRVVRRRDHTKGSAPRLDDVAGKLEKVLDLVEHTARIIDVPLKTASTDLDRELAAWASTWWGRILDCRPSALKAYGSVDVRLERSLTPAAEQLAEVLLTMGRQPTELPKSDSSGSETDTARPARNR